MSHKENETTEFSAKHLLSLAVLFLVIVFFLTASSSKPVVATENIFSDFNFSHSVFEEILVNAEVVYIQNVESGEVVYQKNASKIYPLASLTKIMTAYTAKELLGEDTVTIASSDLQQDGDHGLIVGESWDLDDLLVFMLVTSSNDAAEAVARTVEQKTEGEQTFPELMTQKAQELGFTTLSFKNASGLDIENESLSPSALGSAEDISKLFVLAENVYPDIFNPTRDYKITLNSNTTSHAIQNTNTSLSILPRLESSKTGYTQTAGGNLTVITNIGNIPHVVTVLRSTREGRFQDIGTIINKTQEQL